MHPATVNCRQFLVSASAATTLVACSSWTSTARAAAPARLRLGIQLFSLRGLDLSDALQHAKALGFEQVEFYSGMLPTDASAERIA